MPRKKKNAEAEVATPEVSQETKTPEPKAEAKESKETKAAEAKAPETKAPEVPAGEKAAPKNIIIRNINPAMMQFNIEKDAYNSAGEKTGNKYKVAQVEFKKDDNIYYFDVNPKDVWANRKSPDAKPSSYSVRLNPDTEHTVRRYAKEGEVLKDNETLSKSGKLVYHKETALELQKNVQDASHALLNKFKEQAAQRAAAKEASKEADKSADKSTRKLPDAPQTPAANSKEMQAGE